MSSKCRVNVKLADIHQHLTIASLWGHVVSEERSFAFLPSSFPLPLAGPHEYHKAKSRPVRQKSRESRLQPSDFAASSVETVETGEFATSKCGGQPDNLCNLCKSKLKAEVFTSSALIGNEPSKELDFKNGFSSGQM